MSRRILIVDDEDDIREVAQLSLEMVAGWEVIPARSGEEGVRLAAAQGQLDLAGVTRGGREAEAARRARDLVRHALSSGTLLRRERALQQRSHSVLEHVDAVHHLAALACPQRCDRCPYSVVFRSHTDSSQPIRGSQVPFPGQ